MIYRVDDLPKNKINPITGQEYDSSWIVFTLTCSVDNRAITGMGKEGLYFIRLSRFLNDDWQLSVGDFVGYCEANKLNGILVMSESDYENAMKKYTGHSYNEPILREDESPILIHSTTEDSWVSIQRDGKFSEILKDQYGNEKEEVWLIKDKEKQEYSCADVELLPMMSLVAQNNIMVYLVDTSKFNKLSEMKRILSGFAAKIDIRNDIWFRS